MAAGGRATILVIDDSLLIRMLAKEELEKQGYQVVLASTGEEGLAEAKRNRPDMVVSDVVMPGISGYDVCRRLRQDPTTKALPILLLTGQTSIAEKVRGFEAGADDHMPKPFEPPELVARVGALLARVRRVESVSSPLGRIILCFSLKGGAGTTTLAVNVAASLTQLWEQPVCLVDLSLEKGCASLFLNLTPKATLDDLCRRLGEMAVTLEPADFDLFLTVHNSGIQLLAAPASPEKAELVEGRMVPAILEALKSRFSYIVVDVSNTFHDHTLAVMDASDSVLLLATPDLAGLKVTRDALLAFKALGTPYTKTKLVVNQVYERGGLNKREMEGSLRFPVSAMLPFGGERMVQAVNSGQPIVLSAPTQGISEAIYDLAYLVSDREASLARVQTPSATLARVRKRFSGAE